MPMLIWSRWSAECILIKNKKKFSSYIRNSAGLVQSHIWLMNPSYTNICAFPHILGSPSSYMILHPIPSEFPYMRKILFSFLSAHAPQNQFKRQQNKYFFPSLLFMFHDSHNVSSAWTKDISLTQEKFHLAVTHSIKERSICSSSWHLL